MNIGFVNICHNDYVSEFAVNIAKKAVNNLKLMDISIFEFPEPIIDTFYAENAVRELVKQEIDGIIIFLGTWVECSVAMSLIRKIEHLPLCLWSFPMFIEQ
ncbi:MAG TPA: hypothetical protein GXX37_01130 [Clostridiaceae bacterium]|nr:hypothetical protein [Clostridiaceae bacterium]